MFIEFFSEEIALYVIYIASCDYIITVYSSDTCHAYLKRLFNDCSDKNKTSERFEKKCGYYQATLSIKGW